MKFLEESTLQILENIISILTKIEIGDENEDDEISVPSEIQIFIRQYKTVCAEFIYIYI